MAGPHAALVTRTLVSLSPLACSAEFNIRCYVSLHAQNSLTEEFCSTITSFTVEHDELPPWLQDQQGLSLDQSISRARGLDAERTDASEAAPAQVNLLIRALRRAIAWLNGLDAPVNYDDMLKRLSLAEALEIPPLGFDRKGNTYRVNSDDLACEVSLPQRHHCLRRELSLV